MVFNFEPFLLQNDSLIGAPILTVTVYAGADPLVGNMAGAPNRTGNSVRANVGSGVAGVIYSLVCSCTTSLNANISLQGFMVCIPLPI